MQIKNIKKLTKLQNISDNGLFVLAELLKHKNDHVKLKAASTLIAYNHEDAEKILIELEEKRGKENANIAFIAQMMLNEWKKGNIKPQSY